MRNSRVQAWHCPCTLSGQPGLLATGSKHRFCQGWLCPQGRWTGRASKKVSRLGLATSQLCAAKKFGKNYWDFGASWEFSTRTPQLTQQPGQKGHRLKCTAWTCTYHLAMLIPNKLKSTLVTSNFVFCQRLVTFFILTAL